MLIVENVIEEYPEALFNMQFFNPYLKKKTEHTYADIFKQFKDLNAEEKSHFIELCVMQV